MIEFLYSHRLLSILDLTFVQVLVFGAQIDLWADNSCTVKTWYDKSYMPLCELNLLAWPMQWCESCNDGYTQNNRVMSDLYNQWTEVGPYNEECQLCVLQGGAVINIHLKFLLHLKIETILYTSWSFNMYKTLNQIIVVFYTVYMYVVKVLIPKLFPTEYHIK